jgi:hypothetical protein
MKREGRMADIPQHVVVTNLLMLLNETFEGPGGSVYLDKGAAARSSVTARQ